MLRGGGKAMTSASLDNLVKPVSGLDQFGASHEGFGLQSGEEGGFVCRAEDPFDGQPASCAVVGVRNGGAEWRAREPAAAAGNDRT